MIRRVPDANEREFLCEKHGHRAAEKREELVQNLSSFHTVEMAPYYVMRYGFHEERTSYRANPIAIDFIFGLRCSEEIENSFKGRLYQTLTAHFVSK